MFFCQMKQCTGWNLMSLGKTNVNRKLWRSTTRRWRPIEPLPPPRPMSHARTLTPLPPTPRPLFDGITSAYSGHSGRRWNIRLACTIYQISARLRTVPLGLRTVDSTGIKLQFRRLAANAYRCMHLICPKTIPRFCGGRGIVRLPTQMRPPTNIRSRLCQCTI